MPQPQADACTPFLRWAGGKRWLATTIGTYIRTLKPRRYIEPFLGSGAVFFAVQPKRAILNDLNAHLILTYKEVRRDPMKIARALSRLPVSRQKYLEMRATILTHPTDIAVQFLYLNRTGFSGIYRVNRAGRFNVPYGGGRTPHILWETDLLARAAQAMAGAELITGDFEAVIRRAGQHDVVYCDPTYTVTHDHNGFIRYNEQNFSWGDQKRLATAAKRAAARGATVFVSNAHHQSVIALYRGARTHVLTRASCVSGKASGRRLVREYLFALGHDGAAFRTT
jgi:DNA adenine methylase